MNLAELAQRLMDHDDVQIKLRRAISAKHVYAGTVPNAVKLRRRAANKVARRSRRTNRGR